jgi:clan AA aspartic protease
VKGFVDDQLRALITIPVASSRESSRQEITAWVDTAFNGGLVIPQKLIGQLGLAQESSAEAVLADGKCVELETYACYFDWFGDCFATQVIANDGEFPLLGTMLLDGRSLTIDYKAKFVEIT